MTDIENLRTASVYINNQLLSRGLLREGRAIDFADPSGDGHAPENMARIISVVNDLILRRDRDAEHRESLSTALRTVRAESLRQANDLQRALERQADAQRRADLGDVVEAQLRAQLATAEAATRRLRDETSRLRTLAAQTRASCAHEVRKRDRQIDGLKKAVADASRARGERRNPAITTITIGGHGSGSHGNSSISSYGHGNSSISISLSNNNSALNSPGLPPPKMTVGAVGTAGGSAADPAYDLRSETNAFLAELARSLSDDNEMLLRLVRNTSRRLRAMSGYDMEVEGDEEEEEEGENEENDERNKRNERKTGEAASQSGANTQRAKASCRSEGDENGGVADCAVLEQEMEEILEHLRTILTNPSFVPIEEVMQRETEIGLLRDGWEKMEGRWKEAVHLMDGWRKRMATSGRSVNMEEIKMGLRLSPVRVKNVVETGQDNGGSLGMRLCALVEDEAQEYAEVREYEQQKGRHEAHKAAAAARKVDEQSRYVEVEAETEGEVEVEAEAEEAEAEEDDSELCSDSSSMFADDDSLDDEEPNVQILAQSMIMPSLDDEEVPSSPNPLTRSSPSPPPLSLLPEIREPVVVVAKSEELFGEEEEQEEQIPKEMPARGTRTERTERTDRSERTGQSGLRPSETAANRGDSHVASGAATRSRRRQVDTSDSSKPSSPQRRREARPAGPRAATATTATTATTTARRPRARTGPTMTTVSDADSIDVAVPKPKTQFLRRGGVAPATPAHQTTSRTVLRAQRSSQQVERGRSERERERTEKPEKPEKSEKPERAERAERAEREKGEKGQARSYSPNKLAPHLSGSRSRSGSIEKGSRSPQPKTTAAGVTTRLRHSPSKLTGGGRSRSGSMEMSAAGSPQRKTATSASAVAAAAAVAAVTAATANITTRSHSRSPHKLAPPALNLGSGSRSRSGSGSGSNLAPVSSRLPLPAGGANQPPPSPGLSVSSIMAKLAASEREADAARVRAKLRAARGALRAKTGAKTGGAVKTASLLHNGGNSGYNSSHASDYLPADSGDPVKRMVPDVSDTTDATTDTADTADVPDVPDVQDVPDLQRSVESNQSMDQPLQPLQQPLPRRKREHREHREHRDHRDHRDHREHRRVSRVASRRRSTLNPWELASLMTGSVGSGNEATAAAAE